MGSGMSDLKVPKRQVRVEVLLAGMRPVQLHLFQAEHAQSHSGFERPSDLLNRGLTFLPAMGLDGSAQVVRREAILRMTVGRSAELSGDEPPDDGSDAANLIRLDVEVGFDTGDRARGRLVAMQPENRRRLVDYLNDCPQFFCLRDQDQIHIVNKLRISRTSLLADGLATGARLSRAM
jgi:hypothetical protein